MSEHDLITVRNLVVFARHGVFPEEATLGQRFALDITATLDLRAAGRSDDLQDTINYAQLVAVAMQAFAERRKLLEAAADAVASALLDRFADVATVAVTVRKPSAPIEAVFDHVEITIRRDRHG